MSEEDIILDPVPENIPYQKIAIASKDYPDYDIVAGDAIGMATYEPVWDENPDAWHRFLATVPVYSIIEHEWIDQEDPSIMPEIKTINI